MKIVLFNGAIDYQLHTTSFKLSDYLRERLQQMGHEVILFNVAEIPIPFLNFSIKEIPIEIKDMCDIFTTSDAQIWLSPLYHGGMPGIMKNCLDWLELTSKNPNPYLTNQMIGMICWADGGYALNGIQAMDNIAKSLRAWTLPYSVPLVKADLYKEVTEGHFSKISSERLDRLITLLVSSKIKKIE